MTTTASEETAEALPDLDSIDDRLITLGRVIDSLNATVENQGILIAEIHGFATRLAATLDGLASNPMVAAMLPPDLFTE